MALRSIISLIVAGTLLAKGFASAQSFNESIEVALTPTIRQYCHIVKFSGGWKTEADGVHHSAIDFSSADYEFRVVGPLDTWFLIGAFTPGINGHLRDTTNHYKVNLSDPTSRALPAKLDDWQNAAVVPFTRKSILRPGGALIGEEPAVLNGFQFKRTGARWPAQFYAASRLSPDSVWVVLQSQTDAGVSKSGVLSLANLFFDVFNADTGKKLLTIEGMYSGLDDVPDGCLETTGWLAERYFIVPLGEHRERCLVCEFGAQGSR